jgi:putative DNA methylase
VDAVTLENPGKRLLIADPFAGGGVIALAVLMRGHRVYAQDVNPWAARSLATMLDLPEPDEFESAAEAYGTSMRDGTPGSIVQTMRVATSRCPHCSEELKLYPLALVSLIARVDAGGTRGFVACRAGHLNLASALKKSRCKTCHRVVDPDDRYTTDRVASCVHCGWKGKLVEICGSGGFDWKVVLVERANLKDREIDIPSVREIAVAESTSWRPVRKLPAIAFGDETATLLAHGNRFWHDLYPARQRVVIEALLGACSKSAGGNVRVQNALEAAVIGSTEMAGHASRWDARYLKAYETVANHRFNFTTFAVEPNVWGADGRGRGTVERRIQHFSKASLWLSEYIGDRLVVEGPTPAADRRTSMAPSVDARVVAGSSSRLRLQARSLDAVITDPPYHDDVQYGELSDLFRAWAGETTGALAGDAVASARGQHKTADRYQAVLTDVFTEINRALRTGGHLVLSYANRDPSAWVALFTSLQSAGYLGVGYSVVPSENDIDHAKVGRRACNLDVLIDLVTTPLGRVRRFGPTYDPHGDEEIFCRVIGSYALRIGRLDAAWESEFVATLRECAFLD